MSVGVLVLVCSRLGGSNVLAQGRNVRCDMSDTRWKLGGTTATGRVAVHPPDMINRINQVLGRHHKPRPSIGSPSLVPAMERMGAP